MKSLLKVNEVRLKPLDLRDRVRGCGKGKRLCEEAELNSIGRKRGSEGQVLEEVVTYLRSYFKIMNLMTGGFIEVAKIKVEGDDILWSTEDKEFIAMRWS